MGCVGCQKNNKRREDARGMTIYIKCVGCGTLLHGRKKDMKTIDGNLVCGECFKRYKNMTKKPKDELVIPVKIKVESEEKKPVRDDLSAWKKRDNSGKNVKQKPKCK